MWKIWKDIFYYIKHYDYINIKIKSNDILCPELQEYYRYIERIYRSYKEKCCNSYINKCPFTYVFNSWCKQIDTLPKLECYETKSVPVASTGNETAQGLEGSAERDISLSVSTSLPEHDRVITGNIMTNNTDYYAKLGISLLFWGILSTLFYFYNVISNYILIHIYFSIILIFCCNYDILIIK